MWSPDGSSIVFGGLRDRQIALLRESAAGGSEERSQQDWLPAGLVARWPHVVLEITS